MSFYHRPGDRGGCFSTKGHTFHFYHKKHLIRRWHRGGFEAMIAWSFDSGFEFVWHVWPIQIYFRFRSPKDTNGWRSPVIFNVRGVVKISRDLKQNYWETNGFGFDALGRRRYLTSEAAKMGVTAETFNEWNKYTQSKQALI